MKLGLDWGTLARSAGGTLSRGAAADPVESLSTDTRTLSPGQAFWALKGPNFDAHDHLESALQRGASGLVIQEGRKAPDKAARVVEVPDTLKALQALAAHHRRRFEIPIVAITGSNGKTTTKEMLRCILSRVGPTCWTPGNWNNQLGVPLSVLELTEAHRYGVFELADSKPGDILEVARIAQPTLAVLTNIGPDHLEFYGSLEKNFQTKCELLEALAPDGRAVINADDPWLAGLETRLGPRAVTFGVSAGAKASFPKPDELILDRHRLKVKLKVWGALSRYNAAAAAAAAWALGVDPETIRAGLEDYAPSAMRLETLRGRSGVAVVLDAYNANPASMKAAIEGFCEAYGGKRRVLVLGDMKELGVDSLRFHGELGEWLSGLPLAGVYLAGADMAAASAALSRKKPGFPVRHSESPEAWSKDLKAELKPDTALFLKASRAMHFESLLGLLEVAR